MDLQLRKAALEYHEIGQPGKISIAPTKSLTNQRDMALAYTPGVAAVCEEIVADPANAFRYTARGNLVGVVTNGTAVLGLGNIGPLAGKPVMEGKGCLFKKFAGIDVFDIELAENDPDKLIDMIAALEPTLGGINLEDIKAPECFYIESKLKERMSIPVFHDDQHGTAIISAAAMLNALKVVGKDITEVKVVCSGAGAAAISCLNLWCDLGIRRENVIVCDSKGVIYVGRDANMEPTKARYARDTAARTLADAVVDADIFLGLSAAGVLKPEMVATMARQPIVFALANPTPEIMPELARAARPPFPASTCGAISASGARTSSSATPRASSTLGATPTWSRPRPATHATRRRARWATPSLMPTSFSVSPPPACSSLRWSPRWRDSRSFSRLPTRRRKSCRNWHTQCALT